MKRLPVIIFCALLIAACHNQEKEVPAGGPCSYKDEIYPARLLKLVKVDSLDYDAQFETQSFMGKSSDADTLLFHSVNNQYIKAEQVVKDSIAEGKVYQYVVQQIVSGSCDPHVEIFRMELYKKE